MKPHGMTMRREAFDLFDTDGSGTIDAKELKVAMRCATKYPHAQAGRRSAKPYNVSKNECLTFTRLHVYAMCFASSLYGHCRIQGAGL